MIPLIKPKLPDADKIKRYYQLIQKSSIYTNYGPFYNLAIKHVNYHYDGFPVLVNNGTSSLELILKTTLPRGSRVAIPDFTFIATLNAVINAGMKPIILDVDTKDLCLNIKSLQNYKLRYDAFIVVSPFGFKVDVEKYDEFAKLNGKKVLYDFAGGFGLTVSNKNPTSFSLHATKNLPIGEGGLILFKNESQAESAKKMAGFNLDKDKIPENEFGSNYKLDELHCAILSEQLLKYDSNKVNEIKNLTKQYMESSLFEDTSNFLENSSPQLPILKAKNVKKVIDLCLKNDIMVRRYYYPLLSDCKFKTVPVYEKSINCDSYIALPKDLTEEERSFILKVLNE